MELLKQSMLTALFARECSKTIKQMDIIHISTSMETHTLASTKMESHMAMAFTDGLMEPHITGSSMKVKQRDTESRSMPAIMSMMDNGKTATDQVKQYGQILKHE